jgi:transposase-like protein
MGKNSKVQKIKNTIHNLEVELKIIQKECNHLKQSLRVIKSGEVRWVCNECEIKLKWPSPEELKEWL